MEYQIKRNGIQALTLHINKSGAWYRKPTVELHRESMGSFRFNENGRYTVRHYFVLNCVQVFWLKWIFAVSIHRQFLSENEVMNYNETINHEIDSLKP